MSDRFSTQDVPGPDQHNQHPDKKESLAGRLFGAAVESLFMTPDMKVPKNGGTPNGESEGLIKALKDMNAAEVFKSAEQTLEKGMQALVFGPLGPSVKLGLEGALNYYEHSKAGSFLSGLCKHDVNYQGPPQARFEPKTFEFKTLEHFPSPNVGTYFEEMHRMPKDNRAWDPSMANEIIRKSLKP